MDVPINVLLVENSRLYQEMISDSIKNLGYNLVKIVDNGQEALEVVAEEKIHIVLMDIGLEGDMDGIETSEAIKEFSDVPVIYLTAHTDDKMLERAKVTAPYSYLIKPVEQRVLNINIEIALHNFELEQKLKSAVDDKDFLMKEINHRVKNNLQIIGSLLRMQKSEKSECADLNTALMESESRLHAMTVIHDILYQSDDYREISAGHYLASLAKVILKDFDPENKIKLKTNLDESICLSTDTMVPMGLILNETVTNSIKYAFPDNKKGEFFINLQKENGEIIYHIGDNGAGMDKVNLSKKSNSLGMSLITGLSKQIQGELTCEVENGVSYEIVLS